MLQAFESEPAILRKLNQCQVSSILSQMALVILCITLAVISGLPLECVKKKEFFGCIHCN